MHLRLAALSLSALAPLHGPLAPQPAAGADDLPKVYVGGKARPAAEVAGEQPAGQGDGLLASLAAYSEWTEQQGYSWTLPEGGGLLLAHPGKLRSKAKEPRLTAQALAHVEALFPRDGVPVAEPSTDNVWDDAFGGQGAEPEPDAPSGLAPVVFLLDGEKDQGQLMGQLVAQHPYLANWGSGSGGTQAGFLLERPPLAGVLTTGAGLEEYDPLGELVHRVARLALHERYGRQPDWLRLGLAWDAELLLRKRVDCFPGRSGFVGAVEHTGWDKALRAHLRSDRAPESVLDALSRLTTQVFDQEGAWLAQGTFAYLRERHAGELGELAAAFAADRERREVTRHGDGTWTRNSAYAPSPAAQREILERVLGSDFEAELRQALAGTGRRRGSRK